MSKQATGFVGIDIGASSMKLVSLELAGGKPRLQSYAVIDESRDLLKEKDPATLSFVERALKAGLHQAKIAPRRAVIALPNIAIFQSLLATPKLAGKKLENYVAGSVEKMIPFPLDEVNIAWQPVAYQRHAASTVDESARIQKERPTQEVYVTAVPKALITRHVDVLRRAGLHVVAVETQATALTRSLIGNDRVPTLIIDIGSSTSDIMLVNQGIPTLTRSVEVGGKQLTDAIASSLGLSSVEAEQFKHDLGNHEQLGGDASPMPPFLQQALTQLLDAAGYLRVEGPKNGLGKPEKVVVTGGSAHLAGLRAHLQRQLDLPVYIGDPWARVSYPTDLRATLIDIAPTCSQAVGSAMRFFVPGYEQ